MQAVYDKNHKELAIGDIVHFPFIGETSTGKISDFVQTKTSLIKISGFTPYALTCYCWSYEVVKLSEAEAMLFLMEC